MRSHRHPARSQTAALALLAAMTAAPLACAVEYYKADNTSALNQIASWVDVNGGALATAPTNTNTSPDSWTWDNRVQILVGGLPPAFNLGNDIGVRDIVVKDPAYPVVIDGGGNRSILLANGGSINLTNATQDLTLQNLNTASTAVGLRMPGSNTAMSWSIASGRTLTINSTVAVQSNAGGATVTMSGGGRAVINGEFRPSNLVLNSGTIEFNRAAGSGRVGTPTTVIGNGTDAATLLVGNTSGSATGSSPITLNNNATFTGAGAVSGVVTANAGSTLAPGLSGVGTLSTGSLTLSGADGATPATKIIFEANNPLSADLINLSSTGTLTINGGVVYLYNPGTTDPLTAHGTFELINFSGLPGGLGLPALTIHPDTMLPGRNYILAIGAKGITLRITLGNLVQRSWDVDASGTWSTAANWTDDTIPDAISTIANISGPAGATLTAPRTVTLDAPRTVGQLNLDSTQPVTLEGASTLTLDDGGSAATVNALGANHVISTPLGLTTGGALATVDDTHQLTINGVISGSAVGLVKNGLGTLLLAADNPYTGTTTVSVGTVQLGNGGSTGSVGGPIATTAGTTLRFNRTGPFDLAFPISGGGSVEFLGAADRTLSVANTYSGPTTLAAGSLILAHGQALQNSTLNYSSTGGSLTVADGVTAVTLGGLSGDRPFPLTNNSSVPLALTVGGNNSENTYTASPLGTGASFTKTGSGALNLTGAHAYSGALTVTNGPLNLNAGSSFGAASVAFGANAAARLFVDGGTLNVSGALTLNNASAGFALASGGTATIGGAITNTPSDSGTNFVHVAGNSSLNAASLSLRRGSRSSTSEPVNGGETANGLYIQNGNVHLTGALELGVSTNSNVSGRMDAGALTVDGPVTLAINSPDRWTVLDINGGTFTANHADGVYLGAVAGTPTNSNVFMHVRGASAVAKVPRIQFGQGAFGGKYYLSVGGGALYVGAGGLALGSSNPAIDAQLRLGNGKLGATADWSSPIPVRITGLPAIVTGADEADTPHTVTLSGLANGTLSSGDLTKDGAGTVLFTNPANTYSGAIIVNQGTLGLAGSATSFLEFTVNEGGKLMPIGVLNVQNTATINGGLAIEYDGAALSPVPSLDAPFGANLGASSSLVVSGTGSLPGPAYPIIKGPVSGTFATVSLPAGLSLDYAYDHDNDPGTATVVALVGSISASPYDAWTTSFSLSGNDALASADPDADGLANLLEFAFSSSPVAANAAPWTVARSGNVLTLSFNHPDNSGLVYSVEATNDLAGTWVPVHEFPAFTTAGSATYTDSVDLSTAGVRRFLRLKISAAP